MSEFDGQRVIVTGAGRGIGRETAQLLAARGARVMGVARSTDELEALGLDYCAADLGTDEGCQRTVEEALSRLGGIDVLVCNHGIGSAHEKRVWEQGPEVWRATMRVNLDGPFYLTHRVLPTMIKQQYGRIVYTSSTAGLIAETAGSAYTASKHGLIGLMRSVATDAGAYGITANAVLPGWVRTEMAERSAAAEADERGITAEEVWSERAALYTAGRVVTPGEVAEAIAFLASPRSSGVSGEAVRVALGSVW